MYKKSILIAGGTGLVGSRILELINPETYDIHILTRNKKPVSGNVTYFGWDLNKGYIESDAVKVNHIINLTGAGIADKRWTTERKKILLESRTKSLQLLQRALGETNHRVDSLVSASAIGYYGDRGNEILSEESKSGEGFLSKCCVLWEKAAKSAAQHANKLVLLRIGIVLSTRGGALPKILMTSDFRILNYFGDGSQYYSWIHIDDLCTMMLTAIQDDNIIGTYNAVSPQPCTNKRFTQKIGEGLGKSFAIIPAPRFALQLAMGEMSSIVLDSANVSAKKIQNTSFQFKYQDLSEAIRHLKANKI